ncbi:substrate-binding domain-containing protein [Blastopirellula sp. JC732]|uniref:Substrate-binding domain-containing protein n=1 Tax=Blastopirellula sediminis TaxID=2894196 RepID=A0A9X1SFR7_9BACT|nr:substrate-binding domain-containing protein [Blastopirellula sediminis]MCC9609176.1 substrate-binding domain-containing protein [Blastopirellula sediminis]MCC9628047.1 substrate-binding domain-containing protein [Blastopirellula sediminis]
MLDLNWPYKRHASVYAGTQKYVEEQGWESVIDEYVYDSISSARNKGEVPYDGIIARASKLLAERTRNLELPVVNVWSSSPVRDLLPSVFPDYEASGHMRAEHLLSRGLRKFACLGCRTDSSDVFEIAAFQNAVQEYGYACQTAWIPLAFSQTLKKWKDSAETIDAWMQRWSSPIGVFVGGDQLGRMVVQKCRERGLRVPEDVAIIAGRNEEVLCERPSPSITSVEMGFERVGYEAARLLGHLMDGGEPPRRPLLLQPEGLVVRESTDFFAVQDELVAAALEFIAKNSHSRIGQDDVARALAVETRTLQNRFRKVLGQPIAATVRKVRLERAKRELAQTDRSLKNIARDVGFGSPMRMYELFKRELGVTPIEFRRQRRI